MGAKNAKKVDLKRLAAALADYPFAYLITVDDGYRIHTVAVEPVLRESLDGPDGPRTIVDAGLIGGRTRVNLTRRSDVTLLWPPPEPGGYSLIVDGRAEAHDDTGSNGDDEAATARCTVVPTRALLHRDADPDSPAAAKGCRHDCVVFAEPA
ncbi:pyridoxamine 5'-phosphate oxidase family protein [Mycobacterium spongiae]|uniref:Pyridoxamine 5'-phosphate oxidase family protein n=1 Tax=Mycobacterium spongiae TaxID=886343 RepID=A0A975JV04_9MYCO|nr:pyridoxamine 5'-phosphate oxidase family protein [Mycobacterium spongiae]QUR66195.1 pyridoxamine 5'-phosphate oxidase family protein [Mycobacterium spongiae]